MEEREKGTCEFLDRLGVRYEKYEHEPLMTIDDAQELDQKLGFEICKNLFLSTRHGTEFYLLVMVGSKKFNTGKVSKQVGVPRMTFAGNGPMLEYLNIKPGSVSPLGLIYDKGNNVTLLLDSEVMKMEKIAVHPCVNTATLVIDTKDFIERIVPACGHNYIKVTID